jgi:hypothetical protein
VAEARERRGTPSSEFGEKKKEERKGDSETGEAEGGIWETLRCSGGETEDLHFHCLVNPCQQLIDTLHDRIFEQVFVAVWTLPYRQVLDDDDGGLVYFEG